MFTMGYVIFVYVLMSCSLVIYVLVNSLCVFHMMVSNTLVVDAIARAILQMNVEMFFVLIVKSLAINRVIVNWSRIVVFVKVLNTLLTVVRTLGSNSSNSQVADSSPHASRRSNEDVP